jgi:ferric-dicitrate binding protein FerR (iron transport regulator)
MAPNQKAVFNKKEGTISVKDEPMPELYTGWVEGWYQFVNEDIERVFKKLKRYYNVSFLFDEAVLAKALPISGKLDLKGSLEEVMSVVSKVAKVHYRIEGENIIITQ